MLRWPPIVRCERSNILSITCSCRSHESHCNTTVSRWFTQRKGSTVHVQDNPLWKRCSCSWIIHRSWTDPFSFTWTTAIAFPDLLTIKTQPIWKRGKPRWYSIICETAKALDIPYQVVGEGPHEGDKQVKPGTPFWRSRRRWLGRAESTPTRAAESTSYPKNDGAGNTYAASRRLDAAPSLFITVGVVAVAVHLQVVAFVSSSVLVLLRVLFCFHTSITTSHVTDVTPEERFERFFSIFVSYCSLLSIFSVAANRKRTKQVVFYEIGFG